MYFVAYKYICMYKITCICFAFIVVETHKLRRQPLLNGRIQVWQCVACSRVCVCVLYIYIYVCGGGMFVCQLLFEIGICGGVAVSSLINPTGARASHLRTTCIGPFTISYRAADPANNQRPVLIWIWRWVDTVGSSYRYRFQWKWLTK